MMLLLCNSAPTAAAFATTLAGTRYRTDITRSATPRCSEALPPPNKLPPEGVVFTQSTAESDMSKRCVSWIFQWNHFISLDFFNKNVLDDVLPSAQPQISYPVRMAASAGYRREFSLRGGPDRMIIGDQTILNLVSEDEPDIVMGSLVPLSDEAMERLGQLMAGAHRETVSFNHFTWLGWMEPPVGVDEVILWRPGPNAQLGAGPPTFVSPAVSSAEPNAHARVQLREAHVS